MAITGWSVAGTDIRTLAFNIRSTEGWDSFPASRLSVSDYPFRHGSKIETPTFYRPKDFSLAMMVMPNDATGNISTSPEEHVQENLDTLMGLFHSHGLITVSRTMPDAAVRTIQAKVIDRFAVRPRGTLGREFVARLRAPYPFWHEGTVKNVTGTGALNLVNNGNAPLQDAVITFTTAGRLTVDATGDYIESSASNVVVDLGAWTVTQSGSPADNLLTYNRPWLVYFEPGTNALTATGTVDIDFYDSFI